ncbi:MAG: flavodoxin reductase, partial [Bacteroidales bacterium]|nr:flavodoxin reductase [Bacteroidales bacterium]
FTFTNLPDEEYLEFTIKTYPSHKGVTNELLILKPGDELIIGDAWGTINYKDEGVFIAGGAGVTPFISIFRDLRDKNELGDNKLLFANKTVADIIHKDEFKEMLGQNFINILSEDEVEGFEHGLINKEFLKKHGVNDHEYVYLCGPKPMMESIEEQLLKLNVKEDAIIKEVF